MTRFAMLTDEPERVLRWNPDCAEVSIEPFTSAMAALFWERGQRGDGAIVLDSRGWRFGVSFTRLDSGKSTSEMTPRVVDRR